MSATEDERFLRDDAAGRALAGAAGTRDGTAARFRPRGRPGAAGRVSTHRSVGAVSAHDHPQRSPDGGSDDEWRRVGLGVGSDRLSLCRLRLRDRSALATHARPVALARTGRGGPGGVYRLSPGCGPDPSLRARCADVPAPGPGRAGSDRARRVGLPRPAGAVPVREPEAEGPDRSPPAGPRRRAGAGRSRPNGTARPGVSGGWPEAALALETGFYQRGGGGGGATRTGPR